MECTRYQTDGMRLLDDELMASMQWRELADNKTCGEPRAVHRVIILLHCTSATSALIQKKA